MKSANKEAQRLANRIASFVANCPLGMLPVEWSEAKRKRMTAILDDCYGFLDWVAGCEVQIPDAKPTDKEAAND